MAKTRHEPRERSRSRGGSVLMRHWATLSAMAIALVTRLPGLRYPNLLAFDEIYYVPGAAEMVQWGAEHGLAKHPPLGWWLIALGIRLFGFNPIGWRSMALVAGVATVGFVSATVKQLTRNNRLAFVAALLVALDGVMFTTGRLGMLDAFVGLAVSVIVWLLVKIWTAPLDAFTRRRRYAIFALVAVGAGTAVKWSVAPLLFVVFASMIADDVRAPKTGRSKAIVVTILLSVFVPAGVYLASWIPRQFGPASFTPATFVSDQQRVARYHFGLAPTDDNAAPAMSWFTMSHPTRLFEQLCSNPAARHGVGPCARAEPDDGVLMLAMPNPMVWLVCLGGLGALCWQSIRRRRAIAFGLLAVVASQWGPWLINKRWAYTTYLSALIPTLVIGAAWSVGSRRFERLRVWAIGVVAVTIALFVFFHPVWTGAVRSRAQIGLRLWWWS